MAATAQSEREHSLTAPQTEQPSSAPSAGRPVSKAGKWIRILLLLIILLGAAGIAYWKYTSNRNEDATVTARAMAAANRAVPVAVTPVVSRTMPIYLTALGTVTAYNTVTVKSRVDGQLLSVNVREGQAVKQGQVLAMIDPRPYNAVVAQAEGQLAKDQASADYSKAEAGRYTALYQAGVVSKESEQTQVSNAGASVGTLAADRAAIQAAKVNVAYTRITSPINGIVGLRQVDAGNIVKAADANGLLVVTQLQPIAVIFTIPEDHLPQVLEKLRGGRKLVVETFDRGETKRLATGTLLTVDNQIDTTTGTVKAKAVFDNQDGALFPNQFVNVRLILEERQNSLVIPASGLQQGAQGDFVYVLKQGTPPKQAGENAAPADGSARVGRTPKGPGGAAEGAGPGQAPRSGYYVQVAPVQVDLTEGSQIILKGGVNADDQIVVDGQEKLRPFSSVEPHRATSPGAGRAQGPRAGATDARPETPGARPVSGGGSRAQPAPGGAPQ